VEVDQVGRELVLVRQPGLEVELELVLVLVRQPGLEVDQVGLELELELVLELVLEPQELEQVRERQLEPVELWELVGQPVQVQELVPELEVGRRAQGRERPVWRWERLEALESLERPVWRWAPRVPECLALHREGCPLPIELGQGLRLSTTRPH
jgi:hypothetical protein